MVAAMLADADQRWMEVRRVITLAVVDQAIREIDEGSGR
jgi:hypothetical protein